MAKKRTTKKVAPSANDMTPVVAATLAGVIYQARLLNRQAKLNIPEAEVISDVVQIWRTVRDVLADAGG
jgi:hypothetical protein